MFFPCDCTLPSHTEIVMKKKNQNESLFYGGTICLHNAHNQMDFGLIKMK